MTLRPRLSIGFALYRHTATASRLRTRIDVYYVVLERSFSDSSCALNASKTRRLERDGRYKPARASISAFN